MEYYNGYSHEIRTYNMTMDFKLLSGLSIVLIKFFVRSLKETRRK